MHRRNHHHCFLGHETPGANYGFTVLELLVVTGIIGALVGLLMPALLATREAARRATCTNHLHQIGLAFQHFHDRENRLPTAWRAAKNDPQFAYGWATLILSDLEQGNKWRQMRFQERPKPGEESEDDLSIMVCPSDITEPVFDLFTEAAQTGVGAVSKSSAENPDSGVKRLIALPTANYQGVFGTVEADEASEAPANSPLSLGDGSVIHNRRVRWADLERGLSNTLLIGERTMATIPSTWLGVDIRGEDATCRLVGSAISKPNCAECDECEFSSRHTNGSIFTWADGHVDLISDDIDTSVYQGLSRRAAE